MGRFGSPNVDKMKAKGDVDGLMKALHYQEDYGVREAAADALVKIGTPTVEPLIAALLDSDSDVRKQAISVLGQIGDARAVGPLMAALRDSDRDGRRWAVDALVRIGVPAVEPLIATLKDSDSDVRRWVVDALGQIGDARAVETLIVALKDNVSYVREAAANALKQIGAARTCEPLSAAHKRMVLGINVVQSRTSACTNQS
ncbi:MAG: HEAT repeat domain-containing protein [Bryobacteraceae bacterium]